MIGSVVADLRIRKNDDLPGVGRISSDFLITSQRCIENYFTLAFTRCAMGLAEEYAPVFERKHSLHCLSEEWIQWILADSKEASCKSQMYKKIYSPKIGRFYTDSQLALGKSTELPESGMLTQRQQI
jgi:hypothetical protein